MLHVSDSDRRARLAVRHGLVPAHRYDDIDAATRAMTALHATEASTPHLSLHARVKSLTVDDVEEAIYQRRSIVRVMAMRRTLWIVPRDLVPAVIGSAGRRVADAQRKVTEKEAIDHRQRYGPGWVDAARADIIACLTDSELSSTELRLALPDLAGTFTAAPGTKWSSEVPTMTRLVTIMSAMGDIVRASNDGTWRTSRPRWTSMTSWLGEPMAPLDPPDGYAEVVRQMLWTFGPATEDDVVWWLGATKGIVRSALATLGAVEVSLDGGSTGWVLAGDVDGIVEAARSHDVEPWVALLPTLDPTTMGWKQRSFYLDADHTPYLFDRAGNAGNTVWVNGRIVGCWVQDDDGQVRPILMTDIGRDEHRLLDAEVARLDEFLRGERISNVFRSPQMRGLPLS